MKLKKIRVLIILLILIMSQFVYATEETEKEINKIIEAKSGKTEIVNLYQDKGTQDGEKFGQLDGKMAAIKDVSSKLTPMWNRRYPSSRDIVKKYHINSLDSFYESAFLSAYRRAYQLAYHTEFLERTSDKNDATTVDYAENAGRSAGETMGASRAAIDILKNKKDDWQSAYRDYMNQNDLVIRYNLNTESDQFVATFLSAFEQGFKSAYVDKFQSTKVSDIQASLNAVLINRMGGELNAVSQRVSVANAGIGSKPTGANYLLIEPNTVMQDTYFGMEIIQNKEYLKNTNLLPLEDPIKIYVDNDTSSVKLYKPIYFGMEYTGNHKGGIYQYDGYKWLYQISSIVSSNSKNISNNALRNGYAVYKIDEDNFNGGIFTLMLDENYEYPHDAWESELANEIVAMYKRNYVSQDFNYGYNKCMTKLEYADLIYNAFRYKTLYTEKPIFIKNQNIIKNHEAQVQFALAMGYLKLNENEEFDANSYLSYNDLNFLIKKHINVDYTYQDIAKNLMKKKFYDSGYNKNPNGYPKKDEIAYTIIQATKI